MSSSVKAYEIMDRSEGNVSMETYDVIVIGGGISGLVCANYLAREGRRVVLLEQNHRAGGCMSGFWRNGFYFDAGDQSFESLGIILPILKEIGVYDKHRWERVRYRVKSPDLDFVITSLDDVESRFEEAFPDDEEGIKSFFWEAKRVSHFLSEFADPWHSPFTEKPNVGTLFRFLKWLPGLRRWMDPEFRGKLCRGIKRENLRNWFIGSGYQKMTFFVFAAFWHIWAHDYWYPVEGLQSLMDSLAEQATRHGGAVRFRTPVHKILIRDHRVVKGVVTGNGEEIGAEHIVYTGDYKRLVFSILGEGYFEPGFLDEIRRSRLSEALVSVYIGLDIPPEELRSNMKTHHVFYFPNYDVLFPDAGSDGDIHSRMWIEITSPSLGGSGLSPSGKSSLILQTFSSSRWQDFWKNGTEEQRRKDEYRKFKMDVGMQMVRSAEEVIPGLTERISCMDVGTPLSYIRFTLNTDGASAGWTYDPSGSPLARKFGYLRFRTPVKGLHTAGHYSMWPGGVPTAALSGKIVANTILGRFPFAQMELLCKIFEAVKRGSSLTWSSPRV